MRLDLFLVQAGLAQSRTQAQDLISNGEVFLKTAGKPIQLKKSSYAVTDSIKEFIYVLESPLLKYVSRAGLKLESAIKHLNLNVKNKTALDVGQSTGGFTDCLLQSGVDKVVGIEVGHSQLHQLIKLNPKVICIENLNVKDLSVSTVFLANLPPGGFDLVVMDVSFISITKVIDAIKPYLKNGADYLFLVKPQFEAGPDALDKNGIVKDDKYFSLVENEVKRKAQYTFGNVSDYFPSGIAGKDGNQEFFIYGQNLK